MYYLRIENGGFGFVIEGINDIKDTDVPITEEDYQKLSKLESQAKQFRVKAVPTGNTGLFDYIEEYEAKTIPVEKSETEKLKEEIISLKETIAEIVESANTSSVNTKEGVTDLNEIVDTSTN